MPKVPKNRKKSPVVPYVRGFRAPNDKQRQKAALLHGETAAQPEFCDTEHFHGIPSCTSVDDWLAQYKEPGQSYEQFLQECPWLSTRRRKYMTTKFVAKGRNLPEKYPQGTVYILPLGDEDAAQTDAIVQYSRVFLGLPVTRLQSVCLETRGDDVLWPDDRDKGETGRRSTRTTASRVKSRRDAASGHRQLSVSDVLFRLRHRLPTDAICLIALTTYDLYQDNSDLFVAGMAAGGDRVAVFSLLRYDPNLSFSPEFWHGVTDSPDRVSETHRRTLILQRGCKLIVHEICHLLGLDHCIYYACCMNGSGHLEEDFSQPMALCPVDLRKLQTLCGFSVTERYRALGEFYDRWGMTEESRWVSGRLRSLGLQEPDS